MDNMLVIDIFDHIHAAQPVRIIGADSRVIYDSRHAADYAPDVLMLTVVRITCEDGALVIYTR